MKLRLLLGFLFATLVVKAQDTITESKNYRPGILQNFEDTTELDHVNGAVFYTLKDSSLVYSTKSSFQNITVQLREINSQSKNYLPITGGNITGRTNVLINTDGYRLGIMKSIATSQSGNTTLGAPSTYLQLGGGEWNVNSYRMIGFGYLSNLTDNPPAQLGYQETVKSGSTYGDLVFATRNATSNTAPTIRFRITAAGNVKSYGPVTAPEDVATKGYVDTAYIPTKVITFTGTYSLNGTPSNTFIANNCSADNTITLPTAKNGITYTIWKIGPKIMTLAGAISDAGKNGSKVTSGSEAGSSITVVCMNNIWVITAKNGTWTTE
jgi:hypothetical protein